MSKEKFILFIFVIILLISCQDENQEKLKINTSHLDHLYEEVVINEISMAIIHIYSNYPSYDYIDDHDEGTACVDDAARAAIFYLKNFYSNLDSSNIIKNKKLLEFLIYMQSENGYFYNFIWKDLSINKKFRTSVNQPHWWSWRALWALTESYSYYKKKDPNFSKKITKSIEELIVAIKKDIPSEYKKEEFSGIIIPNWLPAKFASDQASVLLLGLINYYDQSKDEVILDYIKLLAGGILKMQIIDEKSQFYGVFLSWQNTWHSWGNCQSYALLKSYELLGNKDILESALLELNNFYPYLIKKGYLNSFEVSKTNFDIKIVKKQKYSQIAYNFRPMIYALIEANKITKNDKYAVMAGNVAKWFSGNNSNTSEMYNQNNGIVYDGIESDKKVNMNSGAESTIEALLSLLEIKKNSIALEAFKNRNSINN